MKTNFTFSKPLRLFALFVLTSFHFSAAQADTGFSSFGITNAGFTGSATFSALGASQVPVKNQDFATLVYKGTSVTTNASTNFLYFAQVDAQGNVATSPVLSWPCVLAASGAHAVFVTNNFVIMTNLTQSQIGAASSLVLLSNVTVNTGGWTTNPAVYIDLKKIPR